MNESSKKLLILKIPPKKNITLASIQSHSKFIFIARSEDSGYICERGDNDADVVTRYT